MHLSTAGLGHGHLIQVPYEKEFTRPSSTPSIPIRSAIATTYVGGSVPTNLFHTMQKETSIIIYFESWTDSSWSQLQYPLWKYDRHAYNLKLFTEFCAWANQARHARFTIFSKYLNVTIACGRYFMVLPCNLKEELRGSP